MLCKSRMTLEHQLLGSISVIPIENLVQDEISTGLDSSTTFQIIKYLGDLTHTQKNTMLISLLQPAPESYNLFDNVMLIAEGRESLIFLKFFLCLDISCQKTTSFLDFKPCISETCYRIRVLRTVLLNSW